MSESPELAIFEPMAQRWSQDQTLIARSSMPEAETLRLMRRAVLELDPSLTVFADGSLTSALGLALFPAKMAAVVLGSFGALAVILAATGVYGIMAYAVSRRTREIGIRMALGAAPAQVARVVLTRTAKMLAVGIAIGFAMAFAGGEFFSLILYGISAHDPSDISVRDRANGGGCIRRLLGAGAPRHPCGSPDGPAHGVSWPSMRLAIAFVLLACCGVGAAVARRADSV